jgi:hypothetical protein
MPAKINMFITNGNIFLPKLNLYTNNVPDIKANIPLNSGMISRIQNIRPGCGSCGRK